MLRAVSVTILIKITIKSKRPFITCRYFIEVHKKKLLHQKLLKYHIQKVAIPLEFPVWNCILGMLQEEMLLL